MAVQIETGATNGPSSYTTGGFTISTTLSSLNFFDTTLEVEDSDLKSYRIVITRDSPSSGSAKVKLMRKQYDKLTDIGAVSGLPSGVTARATSGGTYDTNTHNHSINHDHAAQTVGNITTAGVGVNTTLGSGNYSNHTHSFDVPAITETSGNETNHTHTLNNIYDHQHSLTNTQTTATLSELPNGTNLSTAVFRWIGVK